MKEARSDEVRQNWRDVLNDVENQGQHVRILRYKTPAAVIVPNEWYEQAAAMMTGSTMEDKTMILAYLDGTGAVATMPVSDRDQFQRGVTTPEAWEAMSGEERAALAASSAGPAQIRHREQARKRAPAAFRKAHRHISQWMNGPKFEYEGTPLGVIEWERTAVVGEWRPTSRNFTVTERWNDDSNDWEQQARPASIGGQPQRPLRKTIEEAEADVRAIQEAAPKVTAEILRDLAAAGAGSVLVIDGGELRIEASDRARGVIAHGEYAAEVAQQGDAALEELAADLEATVLEAL